MALRSRDYNQALHEAHENFTTVIDEPDSTTTYVGTSKGIDQAASIWQIKKIVVVGTATTVSFADNDDSFIKVWNNRALYVY